MRVCTPALRSSLSAARQCSWMLILLPMWLCEVKLSAAIAQGVKAVVVTHLYGQAQLDIAEIADKCRIAGVALVEDCAQAHGARIHGKRIGSFGDVGCFSFYPTKNLGALGDGGAVVTNDSALAERVARLCQLWLVNQVSS